MTQETDVILDVPLTCTYSLTGRHVPATRFDPAEEPWLEITSVKLGTTEIMHELAAGEIAILEDECWGDAVDYAAEERECAAEAKHDAMKEEQLMGDMK